MTLTDKFLEPFQPGQACPKCAHPTPSTRYWPDTSHHACALGARIGTGRGGEHLERYCGRCGFSWEQLCAEEGAPAPTTDLLTAIERQAVEHLAEFSRLLAQIIANGPTRSHDYGELVHHVHVLQRTIGSQAAARAYPTEYRLLGDTIPPTAIPA